MPGEPLRAVARIDLDRVADNIRALRRRLTPATGLCAVVKADGYGHGAVPVARAALAAGADRLAVATPDEARELRDHGLGLPIIILGPLSRSDAEWAARAAVEIVLWNQDFARLLSDLELPVHVKLDTGIGRLGVRDPADASDLAEIASASRLRLAGAMTHLATADDPDSSWAEEQLDRFRTWALPLKAHHPHILLHAANSAATLRLPGAHFDLVRTGIGIYGLDPFQHSPEAHGLRPALCLSSYVAAINPLVRGESCGYGRTFVARHDTTLGLVPIGYGDGVPRALGNRGAVRIAGRRHPIVGAVSMDMLTVDLGPTPRARIGDTVTIIGPGASAEDAAKRLDTINYEVVTRLSPRVTRVYTGTTAD